MSRRFGRLIVSIKNFGCHWRRPVRMAGASQSADASMRRLRSQFGSWAGLSDLASVSVLTHRCHGSAGFGVGAKLGFTRSQPPANRARPAMSKPNLVLEARLAPDGNCSNSIDIRRARPDERRRCRGLFFTSSTRDQGDVGRFRRSGLVPTASNGSRDCPRARFGGGHGNPKSTNSAGIWPAGAERRAAHRPYRIGH